MERNTHKVRFPGGRVLWLWLKALKTDDSEYLVFVRDQRTMSDDLPETICLKKSGDADTIPGVELAEQSFLSGGRPVSCCFWLEGNTLCAYKPGFNATGKISIPEMPNYDD